MDIPDSILERLREFNCDLTEVIEAIEKLLTPWQSLMATIENFNKAVFIAIQTPPRQYGISLMTSKNKNRPSGYGYIKSFERDLPYQRRCFS